MWSIISATKTLKPIMTLGVSGAEAEKLLRSANGGGDLRYPFKVIPQAKNRWVHPERMDSSGAHFDFSFELR